MNDLKLYFIMFSVHKDHQFILKQEYKECEEK